MILSLLKNKIHTYKPSWKSQVAWFHASLRIPTIHIPTFLLSFPKKKKPFLLSLILAKRPRNVSFLLSITIPNFQHSNKPQTPFSVSPSTLKLVCCQLSNTANWSTIHFGSLSIHSKYAFTCGNLLICCSTWLKV